VLGAAASPEGAPDMAGAVIEGVAVVVACGVLATVESPEPQPLNVAAINTAAVSGSGRQGSDHTSGNRTGIGGRYGYDPPRPAVLG
jgi:hypothetical protein